MVIHFAKKLMAGWPNCCDFQPNTGSPWSAGQAHAGQKFQMLQ